MLGQLTSERPVVISFTVNADKDLTKDTQKHHRQGVHTSQQGL